MKKILLFTALSIFMLSSCTKSLHKAEEAITTEGLGKTIGVLASDDFGGRKPFSVNEKKTLDYIQAEMVKIGLEPVFENNSYLQAVPLVEINGKASPIMKIRGRKSFDFKLLDDYAAQSQTTSKDVSIKNLDMVFVGYGINAPEFGWNDYEGVDVKGKAVVCLVNDPGFITQDANHFGGKTMTYYGRWTYKFEEAARQGAKAVFIVHRTDMAGYPWAVPRRMSESSMFSIDEEASMNTCCDIEGWFNRESANKLFASLGYNLENIWTEACKKEFKSFDMKTKSSMSIEKTFNHNKSYNIAGKIIGTEKPDEAIILMAHWDHLGQKDTPEGKYIYNGASDNAAGVAWVLEIAKAFKQMPAPKRTVIFINPTVEEEGLLGSYYFVDHSPVPTDKIVCAINTDVLPFVGEFKDITITGYGHSSLDDLLSEEAVKDKRYVAADPTPENGMFFRSDHFPYMKKGIPCLFAKGMQEHITKAKDWMPKYMENYWKTVYHKSLDTYDAETADLTGIVADAKMIFRFGYKIADSDVWPKWNVSSEFAALRK
jgi:Zn-dependent M28 family amino/carboxypeptidase